MPRSHPKSIYRPEFRAALECLYELRQRAGLTQIELAHKMDRPQSFVSNGENAFRRLDILQIYLWCKACGTDMATLGAMVDRKIAAMTPTEKRVKPKPKSKTKRLR